MRRILTIIVILIFCPCIQAETIELGNLLCLGDSITRGTVPGGYREQLYEDLTASGYSFTFIGRNNEYPSDTLTAAGQTWHCGFGSYTLGMIDSAFKSWTAPLATPNYILLMAGTNDFSSTYYGDGNVIDRLESLVDNITSTFPDANLIVSTLTYRTETYWETKIETEFNPFVSDLVEAHAALGENVTFLDLNNIILPSDIADNCHPNQGGYDKMGDAWFGAIQAVPEPSCIIMLAIVLLAARFLRFRL